jgi:hypothetical protein
MKKPKVIDNEQPQSRNLLQKLPVPNFCYLGGVPADPSFIPNAYYVHGPLEDLPYLRATYPWAVFTPKSGRQPGQLGYPKCRLDSISLHSKH